MISRENGVAEPSGLHGDFESGGRSASHVTYEVSPPRRFSFPDVRELWRYRDLFLVLAWRDIAVRYKQTILGILWAVLQPFVTMLIFTFIFNRLAGIKGTDGVPYPIFVYVGLIFWQYYSGTLTNASNSLVANTQLVQKVYFPRVILPSAAATTGLVDLAVASVLLGAIMAYFKFSPHLEGLLIMPILLLSAVLCAMGGGFLMAAVNVKYRDVRYALPFFVQILMYVTPVIYPVEMLNGHPVAKLLMLWLNPISGIIANTRACILGQSAVDWRVMVISLTMSLIFFLIGLIYFRSTECEFADVA